MELQDGSALFEIAPGSGWPAIELAWLQPLKIVGLDIRRTFVHIVHTDAREAGVDIEFRVGGVAFMPFEDGRFEFLMCKSLFKNFSKPQEASNEMYRVLKKGKKGWMSDLSHEESDAAIDEFVKKEMKMRGLGAAFMRHSFKRVLGPRAFGKVQFGVCVSGSPLKEGTITENEMDWEVWLEK